MLPTARGGAMQRSCYISPPRPPFSWREGFLADLPEGTRDYSGYVPAMPTVAVVPS